MCQFPNYFNYASHRLQPIHTSTFSLIQFQWLFSLYLPNRNCMNDVPYYCFSERWTINCAVTLLKAETERETCARFRWNSLDWYIRGKQRLFFPCGENYCRQLKTKLWGMSDFPLSLVVCRWGYFWIEPCGVWLVHWNCSSNWQFSAFM